MQNISTPNSAKVFQSQKNFPPTRSLFSLKKFDGHKVLYFLNATDKLAYTEMQTDLARLDKIVADFQNQINEVKIKFEVLSQNVDI